MFFSPFAPWNSEVFFLCLPFFVQSVPVSEGFTFLLDEFFFFLHKTPIILLEMPPKRSVFKEKDEGFLGGWAGRAAPAPSLHPEADLLLMLFVCKAAVVNPWFLFGH